MSAAVDRDRRSERLLSAHAVCRRRDHRPDAPMLLAPHSFDLARGELVAFAGPSGSGKTTLCMVLAGWDRPDEGRIEWHVPVPSSPTWRHVAVAPQRLALWPELDVHDNIAMPVWLDPRSDDDPEERVAELAERLDLTHLLRRAPTELSFGEQQRVAIARALVARPTLVILDEPTGHQDQLHTADVIETIVAARDDASTVAVASHDDDLLAATDRVITIERP
ncbi:MAG: ATP-binding cassette domain-containing protein [Ilumatobacteraceae bacterium]|nr:ATP-binding cassette domain-containing protein [Acidimicrobiales bacterium]MCB9396067.1 ATP-binding cassette domain-containing protein [Acidimicrobiaceae bacterium]